MVASAYDQNQDQYCTFTALVIISNVHISVKYVALNVARTGVTIDKAPTNTKHAYHYETSSLTTRLSCRIVDYAEERDLKRV